MSTPLARAHITAQEKLRALAVLGVSNVWASLPAYDEANVAQWLARVLPIVEAAQRQSVSLTEAFLARSLGRGPIGVPPAGLIGAGVRNGAPPADVYRRPFVTVWTALGAGTAWADAVHAGLARARETAAMDVQLSRRATYAAVQGVDGRIRGYRRVADGGACSFCQLVDGAFVKSADAMGLHNWCVTGDTMVWASAPPADGRANATGFGGAHAATRRWYADEVVVLETAAGYELTVTPNHPILTDRGWVAAGLLREGDGVVSSLRPDGVCGRVPDEEHVPARIEECFRARPVVEPVAVPFAAEHFHGDVGQGEVDVVFPDGNLDARVLSALTQPGQHRVLARRFGEPLRFSGLCREHAGLVGVGHATGGSVSVRRAGLALVGGLSGGADDVLLGGGSELDAAPQQEVPDGPAINAEPARQLQDRLSGFVQLDSVRHSRRIDWSGHVFNLVTSQGWYTANGIVTHNCGCGLDPVTDDVEATPLPEGVAVHEHGELGPMLAAPGQRFTTEHELH